MSFFARLWQGLSCWKASWPSNLRKPPQLPMESQKTQKMKILPLFAPMALLYFAINMLALIWTSIRVHKLFPFGCFFSKTKQINKRIILEKNGLWAQVLGADALRMRLRRLCEVKPTGKSWVDQKSRDDYVAGGERREWLELALLESLKKVGLGRNVHKKVVAGLLTKRVLCSHVVFKNWTDIYHVVSLVHMYSYISNGCILSDLK